MKNTGDKNKFFGTQENDRQIALDNAIRASVEKLLGRSFTDEEWFKHKLEKSMQNRKEIDTHSQGMEDAFGWHGQG